MWFQSAPVVSGERLKRYIFHKICSEVPEGPFCIVYLHSSVQKEDNSLGMSILRWIYEDLPDEIKERLQVVYFVHPGLRSRLALATLGRLFLSGGLYWKIKYVSRLLYLWDDIKKGEIEIPEFVQNHDDVLEHRPLTNYGIEPDPLHLTEVPASPYSLLDETTHCPSHPPSPPHQNLILSTSSESELRKHLTYTALVIFCGASTYYSPFSNNAKHRKAQLFRYAPLPVEELHPVSNCGASHEIHTRCFLQTESLSSGWNHNVPPHK
ncbi:hypothetical protein MLD38_007601 [Melastoma candidum]|uniref:Uncharacterized protein n=1 Tax=Melastoma candidum TaxID=119954 RepID=A0ACB9RTJ0_9MYRT|nr:hypothetical protein MLD38_007601 [Melastoma candidum]